MDDKDRIVQLQSELLQEKHTHVELLKMLNSTIKEFHELRTLCNQAMKEFNVLKCMIEELSQVVEYEEDHKYH